MKQGKKGINALLSAWIHPAFPSGSQEWVWPSPHAGPEPWPRSAPRAGDSARSLWAGSSGSASVAAPSQGQTPAKPAHSEQLGPGMAAVQLPAPASRGMWPTPLARAAVVQCPGQGRRGWIWGCAIPTVLLLHGGCSEAAPAFREI